MRAEIIAVGSELLSQARLETNSVFITQKLNEFGLRVMRKFVVEDREEEIQEALESAVKGSEVVILTGGLGPTHDDITREVVSKVLGRDLELDPKILEGLKSRFQRVGLKMTDNNLRQAMVPEGAESMENPNGTAPGLFLREGKTLLFLLPGPPPRNEAHDGPGHGLDWPIQTAQPTQLPSTESGLRNGVRSGFRNWLHLQLVSFY